MGKYIHSANLKHSENKASRAQFLLADFETDNYFYSLFLVFANFGCFTISFTSQVVLKHLNEFGASIIFYCGLQKKNKLKERHVEDGGIGDGGGSIELSGGIEEVHEETGRVLDNHGEPMETESSAETSNNERRDQADLSMWYGSCNDGFDEFSKCSSSAR